MSIRRKDSSIDNIEKVKFNVENKREDIQSDLSRERNSESVEVLLTVYISSLPESCATSSLGN